MFSAVRGNKISQQIIAQIRGMIFEGKLSTGDKLPPENVLTEQFGVSRQTLREALRALEFIGLIEIKKGTAGGPCIAEMDSSIAQEMLANYLYFKNISVSQVSEIRKIIEPQAAAIATGTITDEELKSLGDIVEISRTVDLDNPDLWNTGSYDLAFHRIIGSSTRNPILIFIIDFIEAVMEDMKRHHLVEKEYYSQIFDAHERIYKALRARDPEKASAEMLEHVVDVQEHLISAKDAGVWEKRKMKSLVDFRAATAMY